MIISHKYKFIFIKTGKTAGTSIETYLSQYCGEDDILTPIYPHMEGHSPRNFQGYWNISPELLSSPLPLWKPLLQSFLKKEKFYNHISALTVKQRVPQEIWDSYFKFCVERNPWDKTLSHFHMYKYRAAGQLTLDEYLKKNDFPINFPFYTDEKNNILVDKIIKYETLYDELSIIFDQMNIPFSGTLEVKAKSEYRTDKTPYQEVFTPKQRQMVEKIYQQEILMHGYQF